MLLSNSEKAQITLNDVATYFSEEEWKLLHEWQKELYKNVMNEIHQALISLGPLIATSVHSQRAKEEDPCLPTGNEVISVVIKEEEETCSLDPEDLENKSIDSASAPNPVITSVFSLIDKPVDEARFETEPDPREENIVTAEPVITFVCSLSNQHNDEVNVQEESEPEGLTIGDGYKNKAMGNEDSMNCPEFTTLRKASSEKAKVMVFQISEKGTYSPSPLLSESNEERGKEMNTQCESDFSKPSNSKLYRGSFKTKKKGNLIKHQRMHKTQSIYQCVECDKIFTCKTHLARHQTKHTGEKPYQCDECEKSFTQKGSLRIHQRIHSGELPYTCTECGISFREKKHLVGHNRKIHMYMYCMHRTHAM